MAIIVVGAEKDFAALRPRLLGGKVSSKAAGEVAEAVRKANPHADLNKLTPGTVLTIPDTPGVRVRGELSLDKPTLDGIAGFAEHGKSALARVADAGEQQAAEARKERARVLAALDSIGTATRKPRERGLAKNLDAARRAIEAEDERAKERAETLKKAQEEWSAGLDALTQRIR